MVSRIAYNAAQSGQAWMDTGYGAKEEHYQGILAASLAANIIPFGGYHAVVSTEVPLLCNYFWLPTAVMRADIVVSIVGEQTHRFPIPVAVIECKAVMGDAWLESAKAQVCAYSSRLNCIMQFCVNYNPLVGAQVHHNLGRPSCKDGSAPDFERSTRLGREQVTPWFMGQLENGLLPDSWSSLWHDE